MIDNKIMKLYDRFTDPETGELCDWKDAETGEVIAPAEDFCKQLEALDMERGDIIENLLLGYKNNTAEARSDKSRGQAPGGADEGLREAGRAL